MSSESTAQPSKRSLWVKSADDPDDDSDDDIVTEQAFNFKSDPMCLLWRDISNGPFFRSMVFKHRQQMGPTCVSNVLAMLTNQRPEAFQKPKNDVNTQCPVSWSDSLRPYNMKFAYCSVDCRRLKHYISELRELADLFVVSYYTGESDVFPERITADPDSHGDIVGSHIVILHTDKIYDSAKYHGDGIDVAEYGEKFVKRIFRVVPLDYHRGL